MRKWRLAAICFAAVVEVTSAQDTPIPPAQVPEGAPPAATEIAGALRGYAGFRTHGLWSWHPQRREMLVSRRLDETEQVHRVASPGAPPTALTWLSGPVHDAWWQPTHGDYLVFATRSGSQEGSRLYRLDAAAGERMAISPAGAHAIGWSWNGKGDRFAFTTAGDRVDPARAPHTALHIVDPARPGSMRTLTRWKAGAWTSFRFSEDGRRLVYLEARAPNDHDVWVMDLPTGKQRRISRRTREPVAYAAPDFARDGRAVIVLSDRGSEFRRLVSLDLATGKERVLSGPLPHDVDDVTLSEDRRLAAFTTNESGSHVLRFYDLEAMKELPRPPLFHGVIGGLEWRRASQEVGFHITASRTAGDVFSYDMKANRIARWTNGNSREVNTSEFVEPVIGRWKSFDGLELTGLVYQPPARFSGKRPVLVRLDAAPGSQARPAFMGRYNYLVNELGVTLIYPNVRGASGFGKTFATLDDGNKRDDRVKDVGALLDWIAAQPGLDASRVMLSGGDLANRAAATYPDRIVAIESLAVEQGHGPQQSEADLRFARRLDYFREVLSKSAAPVR